MNKLSIKESNNNSNVIISTDMGTITKYSTNGYKVNKAIKKSNYKALMSGYNVIDDIISEVLSFNPQIIPEDNDDISITIQDGRLIISSLVSDDEYGVVLYIVNIPVFITMKPTPMVLADAKKYTSGEYRRYWE